MDTTHIEMQYGNACENLEELKVAEEMLVFGSHFRSFSHSPILPLVLALLDGNTGSIFLIPVSKAPCAS